MSEYGATVAWHLQRGTEFDYEHFNRDHEWTFAGGEVVQASGSPEFYGCANRVNPDEAVIAATASCHMLTFLSIAAKRGLNVLSYIDQPVGTVEKNPEGRMAITRIVLRPRVVFDGEELDGAALEKLHDSAHRNCFVANYLNADVRIEPAQPIGLPSSPTDSVGAPFQGANPRTPIVKTQTPDLPAHAKGCDSPHPSGPDSHPALMWPSRLNARMWAIVNRHTQGGPPPLTNRTSQHA